MLNIISKLTFANDKDKAMDKAMDKAEKLTGNSCRKVAEGKRNLPSRQTLFMPN